MAKTLHSGTVPKVKNRHSSGLLLIDKPRGITSAGVVRHIKKAHDLVRVGHCGTLDPMATGLLVVVVNEATKIAQYLTAACKTYHAHIHLGVETDTQDADGNVIARAPASHISALDREQVAAVLLRFVGHIEQVPPMFSAVKKDGAPLYAYARKGEEIERTARSVEVHSIELLAFDAEQLQLKITCGKGTYIRTLAHDIGQMLGCGAHLSALNRTACDDLTLDLARPLEQVVAVDEVDEVIQSMEMGLRHFPEVQVSENELKCLRFGQTVELKDERGNSDAETLKIMDVEHCLHAMGSLRAGTLKVKRLFNYI